MTKTNTADQELQAEVRPEEQLTIEIEEDLQLQNWIHSRIIIPVKTYECFMAAGQKPDGKNWSDGYALYSHYYYTARIQKTQQVRANWKYCCNGLGWTKDRYYKAKTFLIDHGFIELKNKDKEGNFLYDSKGHRIKEYVNVRHIPKATIYPLEKRTSSGNPESGIPESGNPEKKCLKKPIQMLKETNTTVGCENLSLQEKTKFINSIKEMGFRITPDDIDTLGTRHIGLSASKALTGDDPQGYFRYLLKNGDFTGITEPAADSNARLIATKEVLKDLHDTGERIKQQDPDRTGFGEHCKNTKFIRGAGEDPQPGKGLSPEGEKQEVL